MIRMFSLAAAIVALVALSAPAAEAASAIGQLEAKQRVVNAQAAGDTRPLDKGADVFAQETIETGRDSRARLRFRDDSTLTMSADASVALDDFVFDANTNTVITVSKGALRFVSDKFGSGRTVSIRTPAATIGIRGTDFWAGPIEGAFGVVLLEGVVEVSNDGGSIILDEPGEGTLILGPDIAPGPPSLWPDERRARALATTSF